MKKKSSTEPKDELRPEYDLRDLLKKGVRGKLQNHKKHAASKV